MFEPATTITFYKNVPFKEDYGDTIKWTTRTEQDAFFATKNPLVYGDCTYQRENSFLAVPYPPETLRNYNYLSWVNPGSTKKIYAFISKMDWVNENCTYVYFSIDFWQTFGPDVSLGWCFVEREHVSDDTVGAHTLPENVALGEYLSVEENGAYFSDNMKIVICGVPDNEYIFFEGKISCYVYNGLYFHICDTASDANDFLQYVSEHGIVDNVISIYMCPDFFFTSNNFPNFAPTPGSNSFTVPPNTNIDGYVPKNNKLLTYPYVCAILENNDGQSVEIKYENWKGMDKNKIVYTGSPFPNGRIIAYPNGYNLASFDSDYMVALGSYPQCTWSKDVYSNWLATQEIRWSHQKDRFFTGKAAGALSSLVGLAAGAATGGASLASSATGAVQSVISSANEYYNIQDSIAEEKEVHSVNPVSSGNSTGCGSAMVATNNYGFTVKRRVIKPEVAKSIDSFFSLYGYKVNELKIPNINSRPKWNYIKCSKAEIYGDVPAFAIQILSETLMTGITFWHGDFVGNYSGTNK